MNSNTKIQAFIISGALLAIVCAVFAGSFEFIYSSIVQKSLIISEDNVKFYERWRKSPTPIYLKFNIFNVTNPEGIQFHGEKPKLEQFGPYVYEQYIEKTNVTFYKEEDTVEYIEKIVYKFNREMSSGSETDEFTMINLLLVVLGHRLHTMNPVTRAFSEFLFMRFALKEKLFITKSVQEIMFDGYFDPFMKYLGELSGDEDKKEGNFAYFLNLNGTPASTFKVNTGAGNMGEYLQISEFNEQANLDFWATPYCNMINGTEGTQFPPGLSKSDIIYLFVSDICRSIYGEFEKETQVHGIPLYRFIPPSEVFEINEKSICYCKEEFSCKDGFVDVRGCKKGVPLLISPPHFYMGEKDELAKLEGLHPQKELHETFLDIEPITGVVLNAAKRIQLNLPLRKYGDLPTFRKVPEVIFPIFWIEESASIGKEDAEKLLKVLRIPFIVVYTLCGILTLVGLILVLIGIKRRQSVEPEKGYEKKPVPTHDDKDYL